jgi:hypothetical protein
VDVKLNPARKRMLRRLFIKKDNLERQLVMIDHAINSTGREYWKEQGYRILPRCGEGLRREVFKEDEQ